LLPSPSETLSMELKKLVLVLLAGLAGKLLWRMLTAFFLDRAWRCSTHARVPGDSEETWDRWLALMEVKKGTIALLVWLHFLPEKSSVIGFTLVRSKVFRSRKLAFKTVRLRCFKRWRSFHRFLMDNSVAYRLRFLFDIELQIATALFSFPFQPVADLQDPLALVFISSAWAWRQFFWISRLAFSLTDRRLWWAEQTERKDRRLGSSNRPRRWLVPLTGTTTRSDVILGAAPSGATEPIVLVELAGTGLDLGWRACHRILRFEGRRNLIIWTSDWASFCWRISLEEKEAGVLLCVSRHSMEDQRFMRAQWWGGDGSERLLTF
jgi:hypothetical protein